MEHQGRREWSRYYRIDGPAPVEVLHARFVTHHYPRHVHEYFVIGVVVNGAQSYSYRGARHVTPAGHVFLVNPGEPHTGETATPTGYEYQALYLGTDILANVAADMGRPAGTPFFKTAVLADPLLAALLSRFHRRVAEATPREAQRAGLVDALVHLIGRHADPGATPRPVGSERPAVRRAREYLEAHYAEDVSLAEIGGVVSLNPYHLARAFAREIGVAPHTYLEGVRIRKARECLDRGDSIAAAALSVGYADQSHLTRRFKRFLGITPGQYRPRSRFDKTAGPVLTNLRHGG